MARLAGKIAVVTGGSRGLGRAIVRDFEAAGARVVPASRSLGYDVTREPDVARLFRETLTRYGEPDILVNAAGVLTPRKTLWEVTLEEWNASLAVNLTGVYLCMREALRLMTDRRDGLVLNVASGVSDRAAPTWGPYAAAKWGVEGLTRLAAEETRELGVRIVSLNPGRTRTEMRAAAYPEEDPGTVKTPKATARFFTRVAAGEIPFASGDLLQYREDD